MLRGWPAFSLALAASTPRRLPALSEATCFSNC
jgi:hypothetical protein